MGYTALSRHRQQARFYTSAQPAFVNQPAPAVTATDDVEHHVIRALGRSESEQTAESRLALRREEELGRARDRVRSAEERLEKVAQDRARTSRLRRHARSALDEREQTIRIDVHNSREDLDKLRKRPGPEALHPGARRARDPLDGLEVQPPGPLDRGPELEIPDTGLDLGW